jgi:hypothetical protein
VVLAEGLKVASVASVEWEKEREEGEEGEERKEPVMSKSWCSKEWRHKFHLLMSHYYFTFQIRTMCTAPKDIGKKLQRGS